MVARAGQRGLEQGGAEGMARVMLAERRRLYAEGLSSAYELAQAHALADESAAALSGLQLAFDRADRLGFRLS